MQEINNKEITIIVNTQEELWNQKEISYKDLVLLAFGSYVDDENIVYTITFSRGPHSHHEGFLVKGDSINVKKGMIFNVTQTNKS